MAGKMNWSRVRKEKAIQERGYEGLDGPPLEEEARQGFRNEMNAADPDSDRDTRGHLARALRDGKGAKWEIVDPASVRHRRRPPGKKRGQ